MERRVVIGRDFGNLVIFLLYVGFFCATSGHRPISVCGTSGGSSPTLLFFYVYGVVGAKMEVSRSEAAEDADVG